MSEMLRKRQELIEGLEQVKQNTEEVMTRLRDRVVEEVENVREVLNQLPDNANHDTTEVAEEFQRIIRENGERIKRYLEMRNSLVRKMNEMPPYPFLIEMVEGFNQVNLEMANWLQEENNYIRTLLEELEPNQET